MSRARLFVTPTCGGCRPIKTALARRPDVAALIDVIDASQQPGYLALQRETGLKTVPALRTPAGATVTDTREIMRLLGLS
jgi:hypothetical protein